MRPITSLALLALAAPAAAQVARPSVQVDTTTTPRSFQGGIAAYNGQTATAWKDNAQGIWAATSDDGGQTYGPAVRVDQDGGLMTSKFIAFGTQEAIQRNGDHVYVIWEDVRDTVTNEIYFNRSIDGGATFETTDQNLSQSFNNGYVWTLDQAMTVVRSSNPEDDLIHVVFTSEDGFTLNCDPGDPTAGPEDILYTGSIDGGNSFNTPVLLSSAAGSGADVDDIAICADGDRVYVAWVDSRNGCLDDVYFTYSDDQGQSWNPEIALETAGAGDAFGLTMDCDGLNVAVAWQEDLAGPDEARLAVSTDGGLSFAADQQIGAYIPGTDDVDDVKIAWTLGNLAYVMRHNGSGSDEIQAATSTDNGATFGAETQLSPAGGSFPRISEGGDEVAVVWGSSVFPNPVEASYSVDGGLTWGAAITVNDTPLSDTDFVEVGYDPIKKNVAVAWLDDQDNGAGVFDNSNNRQLVGGFAIGGPASVTFRNGGTNPASYTASAPILGDNFAGTIDVGSTGNALGTIVGYASSLTLPFQGRTILVNILDPGGELLALPLAPGPIANIIVTIPNDPCLAGLPLFTQGIHVGGAPYVLSNAQDLVLGAF